jgi:hypothetical protein
MEKILEKLEKLKNLAAPSTKAKKKAEDATE